MTPTVPAKWGLRTLAFGYLGLLLLAPVAMIFYKTFEHGIGPPVEAMTSPEALHSIQLTLLMVAVAVPLNTVFGVGCALLLVRHRWRGNAHRRRDHQPAVRDLADRGRPLPVPALR